MAVSHDLILEHLETYKFLTSKQLHTLGVSKHPKHVRLLLKELKDKKRWLDYHEVEREGGKEAYYWFIKDRGKGFDRKKHLHLRAVVDLHIAIRRFALLNGYRVDVLETDFAQKPNIQGVEPDLVCKLNSLDGDNQLFVCEVFCDGHWRRPVEKLHSYLPLVDTDALETVYKPVTEGVWVLSVFTRPILRNVTERLKLGRYSEFYAFSEGIGFPEGFVSVEGKTVRLV